MVDHREVQHHFVAQTRRVQQGAQLIQLGQRLAGNVAAERPQLLQRGAPAAVDGDQTCQPPGTFRRHAVFFADAGQIVGVFLGEGLQRAAPEFLAATRRLQQGGDNAQMADLQHILRADERQALRRQLHHFEHIVAIHVADTFQAGLHDLLELARPAGHPVHIFVVAHLALAAGVLLALLQDGEGHIRL